MYLHKQSLYNFRTNEALLNYEILNCVSVIEVNTLMIFGYLKRQSCVIPLI